MKEYKHPNGYISLTKENFWNELKEVCPEAVEHFCNWIDEYKKEIGWDKLFAPGIKFHDLPFEFQNGILARFDIEKYTGKESYTVPKYADKFRNLFADLQASVERRKPKQN